MKLEEAIINVKAFLPDAPEVIHIITSCDLRPKDSWKTWADDLGNVLSICSDKKVISRHEAPLNSNNFIVRDLYHKASIKQLSKICSKAIILFAEGDRASNNLALIWMLDHAGQLRLAVYSKSEWIENQPPLATGIPLLKIICNYYLTNNFNIKDIQKNIKTPVAGIILDGWATDWPPTANTKLKMLISNQMLASTIIKDCGI